MTEEPQWTAWKAFLELIADFRESGVGKEAIIDALRKEIDIHSAFTWERFLREGIDSHFKCRYEGESDRIVHSGNASDYWTQTSFYRPTISITGKFSVPSNFRLVTLYTKNTFNYPIINAYTIWPTISSYHDGSVLWLGFEDGASGLVGLIGFRLYVTGGVETLRAYLRNMYGYAEAVLTFGVPSDFQTELHSYAIELGRNIVVWYIDAVPVAYGLMGVSVNPNISGPPYAIIGYQGEPARDQEAFLEAITFGTSLDWIISPLQFVIANGDPCPPKVIPLYDADTENLFTTLTIAAGSETSHPFPLFGYDGKTIYFQADQAGNFDIEILDQTGNWRVHSTIAFLANTLSVTTIADEAVIGRIVVTPTAFPCDIDTSEVVLR